MINFRLTDLEKKMKNSDIKNKWVVTEHSLDIKQTMIECYEQLYTN